MLNTFKCIVFYIQSGSGAIMQSFTAAIILFSVHFLLTLSRQSDLLSECADADDGLNGRERIPVRWDRLRLLNDNQKGQEKRKIKT